MRMRKTVFQGEFEQVFFIPEFSGEQINLCVKEPLGTAGLTFLTSYYRLIQRKFLISWP